MGEVIFIIGLILGLVAPFLFLQGFGRILWLITMSTIGVVVGGMELISKLITGVTISRHFWNWSLVHPQSAWMVLGFLLIGWLILLIHLAWKMIFKRKT